MKGLWLIMISVLLTGCATSNSADSVSSITADQNAAGNAAARSIAPITQYVNTHR